MYIHLYIRNAIPLVWCLLDQALQKTDLTVMLMEFAEQCINTPGDDAILHSKQWVNDMQECMTV